MALKFSYFDPDKNVSDPNFATNLLQTGMLTILQSRLDMHIMRGDDPFVPMQDNSHPPPSTASQVSPDDDDDDDIAHKTKHRKFDPVLRGALKLEVAMPYKNSNTQKPDYGAFYQLAPGQGYMAPTSDTALKIFLLLLDELDQILITPSYRIVQDDAQNNPVQGVMNYHDIDPLPPGETGSKPEPNPQPIFQNLAFPGFKCLWDTHKQNNLQSNAAFTGLVWTGDSDDRIARIPYLCDPGTLTNDKVGWIEVLTKLRDGVEYKLVSGGPKLPPLLWIPDKVPELYWDPDNDDVLFTPRKEDLDRGATFYRAFREKATTPTGREKTSNKEPVYDWGLGPKQLPFYSLQPKTNDALPIQKGELLWFAVSKESYWPRAGNGGGGRMRCDRDDEFEYDVTDTATDTNSPFVSMSRTLGLAPTTLTAAIPTMRLDYWTAPVCEATFGYGKTYNAKPNEPQATVPTPTWDDPLYQLDQTNPKSSQIRQVLKVAGFTRKKKGGQKSGENVVRSASKISKRKDASEVMKPALIARFGWAPLGQDAQNHDVTLDGWDGSATKLVSLAFSADPSARTFWKEKSKNVRMLNDGAQASDDLKARIRTEQEWCHLFGHGDGGAETPENFVSGSKHCNSEQLALELAQRLYRDKGIRVKVSAYLMPAKASVSFRGDHVKAAVIAANLPDVTGWSDNVWDEKWTGPLKVAVTQAEQRSIDQRGLSDNYEAGKTAAVYATVLNFFRSELTKTNSGTVTLPDETVLDLQDKPKAARLTTEFLWDNFPIAYRMRYRVYFKDTTDSSSPSIKAIDHLYSGQREEMDYNEYRALNWYFRLRIAKAIGDTEVQSVLKDMVARQT